MSDKNREDEIRKSVEAILDDPTLFSEESDEVEKSKKDLPENGGEDKMKSGSPYSEKQKADEAKKSEDSSEEDEDAVSKSEDKKEEKEKDEAKKSKDEDEDEKEEEKEKEEKSKSKMKKSIDELAEMGVLDADELELIQAWREDSQPDVAEKSKEDSEEGEDVVKSLTSENNSNIVEQLTKSFGEQLGELKKSLEERDEMIKSLNEKYEKISNQPAYDPRGIENLDTLEKADSQEETISKSQVLDTMLDLQKSGKGITSSHVAEFESTGNISSPKIKKLVYDNVGR